MSRRPQIPAGPYLVVGLARSGTAAALALRARGEEVLAVDEGEPSGLQALADAGVEVHLGDRTQGLLERARAVVKSPGVPAEIPLLASARERELPVLGELELAWRLLANEFIAVTGTNGKTTTVELIAHVHRTAGLQVAVAGNVGTAASTLVGSLAREATIVCEVSSFQLEDAIGFAPEAAVLLNITPDHLDRHGSMEAYRRAKLAIFARQGAGAVAVAPTHLGGEVAGALPRAAPPQLVTFGAGEQAALEQRAGELYWRGQRLMAASELRLRGLHNLENAMAAAAVCLARGVDREAVRAGLCTFAGVPHRLEEVASRDGVLYVNDSKATNVASTLVALQALADPARALIHLILGGQGKGQDFLPLREPVARSCAAVYLIGQDAPVIARALEGVGASVHDCRGLERALRACQRAAARGEVVLLSPACASFDQFRDFEARGGHFRELVLDAGFAGGASK